MTPMRTSHPALHTVIGIVLVAVVVLVTCVFFALVLKGVL